MSSVVIESRGMSKLISDMEGYISDLNNSVTDAISIQGNNVVQHARNNHRFESGNGNSGNLERSVTFDQSKRGNLHIAEIYLNDALTSPDGRSYGTFIHEGTYDGYDQSPMAPSYTSSTTKSGNGGWKADPFLWNAFEAKWRFKGQLSYISNSMKKKYERL